MDMRERLIIALDFSRADEALALVDELKDLVSFYKVGMQLFNAEGPGIIERLRKKGVKIFLDLKYHDIPNTVAGAAEVAVRQGVEMFNLHLSGGRKMVETTLARVNKTVEETAMPRPLLLGVTVLTSLDEKTLQEEIGIRRSLKEQVLYLAKMGEAAGLDGVVASPQELGLLRRSLGESFLIVTPGVRPSWAAPNEQKRITTPEEAIQKGSDYLVVGRPVTKNASPREAAKKIITEMNGGNNRC
ncbi:MAG: orotidine-5'-phosphate decarboxylase [Firmicutes bacterium]|nr:orotidine-5'-phosphate decarboxylase [Bacillota bacterium]